ncbi:YdeI/OmpD-associated family protein [Streptantibioticus silvisoli]|uniref:YdeI/OmpD-associated family protein n=1 Tax=Streptantibioticus silvisoli TaxID=2705255 RepID=A0ABT6VWN2_9ACTN|nr:YdeI/OmpD-associated family protein [Streptantibioticus silvisoli]MDI5961878.1 YdeI/OmpD-associated family protein [Streptantibioticus silvisoli]
MGDGTGAGAAQGTGVDREIVVFDSADAFADWLAEHHATSAGVWLKLRKKTAGPVPFDYAQALDVALCFGWIDGRKGALDDAWWLQRFTRRAARGAWSKINRDKATALIDQGRMRPAGLAEVERAKADGRWDAAYDGSRTATVPDDLAAALSADPAAAAFFETLDRTNRYAVLYRVQEAKRPETRARRIEKYVRMLAEGRKIHP